MRQQGRGDKEKATRKKQQGRGDKEEATRKRRQRRGDKEEATRRNPSQCGSRAKSRWVARDLSPWRRERCRGAYMVVDHGSSTPEELYNTLFWLSPLSSKFLIDQTTSLFSLPISVFRSLSLVQVGRLFHWQYLHFMIFWFSSPSPSLVGRFFINWSFVRFSSSVSHWVRRFFTNDMIFFKTHQLFYGARMFLLVSRFSSSVPTGLRGFSLTPEAGFSSLPSSFRTEVFSTACRSFWRFRVKLSFHLSSHYF